MSLCRLIKPVSATPDSISLAAAPGQQVTLNPDGVTLAGSPTDSSMTVSHPHLFCHPTPRRALPSAFAYHLCTRTWQGASTWLARTRRTPHGA